MDQAITALGKNGFVGVYAANDGTAGGAIAAMKAAGIDPTTARSPARTPSSPAIQRILAGEQYMTVYKAIKPEAEAAAELAVACVKGKQPPAASSTARSDNGRATSRRCILDAGRGDQGQHQGHGHQGRLLEGRPRSAPAQYAAACKKPASSDRGHRGCVAAARRTRVDA